MSFDYVVDDHIAGTPDQVTRHIASGGMGAGIGRRSALQTLKASLHRDASTYTSGGEPR
jgi:hypothetical protein